MTAPAGAARYLPTLQPELIVLLGATAAQSLLGAIFRVSAHRGERLALPTDFDVHGDPQPQLVATVHPSAVLRDRTDRNKAFASFLDDLRRARSGLSTVKGDA